MLIDADLQCQHLQRYASLDSGACVSSPVSLAPMPTLEAEWDYSPINGQPIYWDITAPPRYDPVRSVDAQVSLRGAVPGSPGLRKDADKHGRFPSRLSRVRRTRCS